MLQVTIQRAVFLLYSSRFLESSDSGYAKGKWSKGNQTALNDAESISAFFTLH